MAYMLPNKFKVSSRGVAQVVEELDKMLALNDLLISLNNHQDEGRFAPGVGSVSLLGKEPKYFNVRVISFDWSVHICY